MMINTGGAYSSKFKALEKQRLDKMRSTNQVVRVAVHDRARSLSLETNRRRRALELKKKLEAQKEAKRRQEILDDRKQRQYEATQKYQRLKSGTTRRKTEDKVRGALYGTYDGGSYGQSSHTWNNGSSGYNTPGLDDALRAVRGSPGLGKKPNDMLVTYPQNSSTISSYSYYQSTAHNQPSNGHVKHDNQIRLSNNQPPMNANGKGVYYHGFTSSATPSGYHTNTSTTTVKSIYEKQIEDQQRNIVEQNQKSLLEFNKAVLDESDKALRRSSSCSSVDSLEGHDAKKGVPLSKACSTSILPSNTQSNHYTYFENGVQMNNTSMQQNERGFDYRSLNLNTKPAQDAEQVNIRTNKNVEVKLEDTSESDLVQDQVDVKPRSLYTSSNNRMDIALRNSNNTYATRTTVAWASPQAPTEQTLPTTAVPYTRPYSGKTTSTLYTVDPASHQQYKTDDRVSKPEHNADTSLKSELTVKVEKATDQAVCKEAGSNSGLQVPKSILKKGNLTAKNSAMTSQQYGNYTMGRLGGAKVMDSLELRKASSMSDIGPSKKGIRWADLEYSSDDDHRMIHNAQVNKKSSDQLDMRSKVTIQNQGNATHEGRISSAGSIQRSSVAQHRRVNRQSLSSTSTTKGPEKIPVDNNTVKAVTNTNGNAIYAPNGIRLDRTPTDDEINWLWDKVRTCLNVREEEGNATRVSQKPPSGKQPSISAQYIDGKRIGNGGNRMKPAIQSPLVPQNASTHPRRRTSSDTASSFLRRTALLQQRRQHAASLRGQNTRSSHHTEPVSSTDVPSFAASDRLHNGEVSDSLMLFQRAEQLAQDDLSETEIAAAIELPKKSNRPDIKGPSALSMEEQRLLESLDRLNERLRITSEATSHLSTTYAPVSSNGSSTGGGGFKGHRPLSSTYRTTSDTSTNKPRIRTLSADRANGRTNYRY